MVSRACLMCCGNGGIFGEYGTGWLNMVDLFQSCGQNYLRGA